MTLIDVPHAHRAHAIVAPRADRSSRPAMPVRTWSRRMATVVRTTLRDRQSTPTLSEAVLSEIHGVRSAQR